MSEEDTSWSPTQRETVSDVTARVQQFLTWLCTQPSRNICVVSHGIWMETLLHRYAPGALHPDARVYNGDAHAVTLVARDGQVLRVSHMALIR